MPDNPRTDGELECHLLFRKRSGDIYCIGSKDSDRYIAVRADDAPVVYKALLLLDGSRSVEDAQNKFDKELASGRSLDIGRLYEVARKAGIVSDGSERGFEAHDETDLMLVDIKTVSLEYIMPALEFVAKHLPALSIVGALLVACAILVAPHVDYSLFYSLFSDSKVLIFAWIVQVPSIILHELSHAVVAVRMGARPKELSICFFYYVSLALYVKIPGIYFLPSRRRIAIWCAGVVANLLLSASFLILSVVCPADHRLFLLVGMFVNLMMAVNNLMPFMYSDGYYVLSTLLKMPNLRKKSLFGLKDLIGRGVTTETLPYWAYLLSMACVLVLVFGGQLLLFLQMLTKDISVGAPVIEMIDHYKNIIIIIILGISLKLIKVRKRAKRGA